MVHFILACNKIKKMFVENTISIYASNVVFFIMLSFFPFAMFFFTILKYIPGITQENLIPMIGSVVPGELGETLVSWIQEAYRHSSGTDRYFPSLRLPLCGQAPRDLWELLTV